MRGRAGPSPDMAGLTSLAARRPRLTLALALGLSLAAVAALQRLPPPAAPLEDTPVVRTVLSDPGSPAFGPASADVVVVVFTDYQCGVCKRTDPALRRLMARDRGVRVVFKDWPVFGEGSEQAARAALAAHRQGRYLALHAALMDQRGPIDAERLRAAAVAAGVDWPRLQADLVAHGQLFDTQIGRHRLQAFSLGLAGTPAYLVGPHLIQGGLGERDLAQAVARARRDSPRTSPKF